MVHIKKKIKESLKNLILNLFGCTLWLCRIWESQFPDQGSNLGLVQWKLGVLTTGLQGNSQQCLSLINQWYNLYCLQTSNSKSWLSKQRLSWSQFSSTENVQKRNMDHISWVIRKNNLALLQLEFRVWWTCGFDVNYLRIFLIFSGAKIWHTFEENLGLGVKKIFLLL